MTLQKKNTKQRCVLKINLLRQIQLLFKQIFKVHLQYKILMALETWEEGKKSFSFFLQNCKSPFPLSVAKSLPSTLGDLEDGKNTLSCGGKGSLLPGPLDNSIPKQCTICKHKPWVFHFLGSWGTHWRNDVSAFGLADTWSVSQMNIDGAASLWSAGRCFQSTAGAHIPQHFRHMA